MSLANFKTVTKDNSCSTTTYNGQKGFLHLRKPYSCYKTQKKSATFYQFLAIFESKPLFSFSHTSVLESVQRSHFQGVFWFSVKKRLECWELCSEKTILDYCFWLGNLFVSFECQHFVLKWFCILNVFFYWFWEVAVSASSLVFGL